jgi:photosystem II stability/assembly factor-like uncharacterized protein
MVLAGTLEDGLFRSEDRGGTWFPANFGLLDLHVLSLAHVVDGERRVFLAGTETGVFRSTNGGRAWRETDFAMDYGPVLCLAAGPAQTVYAGTESAGLLVSTDAGKTWTPARIGLDGAVNQVVVGAGALLILHDDALLVSRDGGAWEPWTEALGGGVTAVAAPSSRPWTTDGSCW